MFNFLKPKSTKNPQDEIKTILSSIKDPVHTDDIISSGAIQSILLRDGKLNIIIEASRENAQQYDNIAQIIEAKFAGKKYIDKISVVVTEHINKDAAPSENQIQEKPTQSPNLAQTSPLQAPKASPKAREANTNSIRPPNIGKIIAIASGKGGVGKSTLAFNIAYALAQSGKKTGLLDADIYGPSIPTMLGETDAKAEVNDKGKLQPIEKHGLKATSIGFVVEKDKALIWRGPMALKALTQFFTNVEWGDLDYLILDLPPGTGDVPLTLAQQARIDGVIIVSTPQEVALADVRRGVELFQRAGVEIIGLVENMSVMIDETTGTEIDLFGKGGAKNAAAAMGINFLGELNFYPQLRTSADKGEIYNSALPQINNIIGKL